jgi:hypothetical protein
MQAMADNLSNSTVGPPAIEGTLLVFLSADRGEIRSG